MSDPNDPHGEEGRPPPDNPYGNPQQNPYGNRENDPYGNRENDPYGNRGQNPYGGSEQNPYGNYPPPQGGGYANYPPPGHGNYPQYGYNPYGQPQRQSSTPTVLSVIGIVCWFLCSPAAIVLGLIGQSQASKYGQSTTLPKVAWIGGIVFLIFGGIISALRVAALP